MSSTLLTVGQWPRWAEMWSIALVIYIGCKWLTWQAAAVHNIPVWKQCAYLLAWPGMDAASFLGGGRVARRSSCPSIEWTTAIAKLVTGLALIFVIAPMIPPHHAYVVGWIGMIGLVLILHFGAFHLLSCWWRGRGVDARALMNRPLAATSLSEFWGRRWNTAFRDLTYRFLFRPCASWFGTRGGVFAGFLFSGVIHDVVISVPARGGYGGPTLFFAIQGAAMVIERTEFGRGIGLGSGSAGRLFTLLVLIAPLGLLFHPPFVVGIIVPFMQFLGAI